MTKIYDLLAKQNGKGISHFRFGYAEIPTAMLTFYDMSDLNSSKFDFRTARMKKVRVEQTSFSDEKKVIRYEESIKEASFTAAEAAVAGDTSLKVSITTIQKGDTIRNVTSGESFLVVAVTGDTLTLNGNVKGVGNGDTFMRYGFAKKYGADHTRTSNFNDLSTLENYVQFVSEKIDSEKTDVLTMNLNRMLYRDETEYVSDLFAQASRSILKTMVQSLYVGVARTTTVDGKTIYEAGGLEDFIPSAYLDKNIKGGTDKATIANIRTQLRQAYQSGVEGVYKPGRMVLFVNSAMNEQLDDLFIDKISQLDNNLSEFGINVRRLMLSGYKIDIVEDGILNDIYGTAKVAFLVDLEGVVLYNLQKGIISDGGKNVDKFGVSQIFVPAQTTPEYKEVQLHTHFTYLFPWVTTGLFQKWIYA